MPERVVATRIYTTQQGDTFPALALWLYGSEVEAWRLIEWNPDHSGTLVFDGGVRLLVPVYEG